MMTNLLDETELAIWDSGHTPGDIVFIGSVETAHACTWEQFRRLANFEYETHLDERVQWPKLAEIQPDDGECGSLWQ
jgi:hypothetical protein